jgi:hypothetical protein
MSRYRANIEVLLDKEFARNLPFLHGPSHLMANQGPESRLTVCCTFHNDGRGLERDWGANGAEMLASQTVVGQFRNTPSRTGARPGCRSISRRASPDSAVCASSRINHCYMNVDHEVWKRSTERLRRGKWPERAAPWPRKSNYQTRGLCGIFQLLGKEDAFSLVVLCCLSASAIQRGNPSRRMVREC